MPFELPPLTFQCGACTWSHTTPGPMGDCCLEGFDGFEKCPRCGASVASRNASMLEIAGERLKQLGSRGRTR